VRLLELLLVAAADQSASGWQSPLSGRSPKTLFGQERKSPRFGNS